MNFDNYTFTVTDRFLRYVKIDTQSDPESSSVPSTVKQKNLARMLVDELRSMGIADAETDDYGYVYATLPSNVSYKVPVVCFCSHMDTSPDCTGTDVNPIVHYAYDGGDIVLPADRSIVIRPEEHPDLLMQKGNDIITADGSTLLGADNKAGLAEIMDAVHYLLKHPEVQHGTIKILFTPDEEIGRGVNHVDLKRLGADYAYTVDGESRGSLEDETFSADGVTIKLHGISAHPGFAKGKMVSAMKAASDIVHALPRVNLSPESTSGRDGFIHPLSIQGNVELAVIKFIIRDFITGNLELHEALLRGIAEGCLKSWPGIRMEFIVEQQYRNMKDVLDKHPLVAEVAMEAIRRAGMEPRRSGIRGGTDGSRLSFMGLPCPNIFAGEHAFHGKMEWVSIQDMQKAVETIVNIAGIWSEKASVL
jgi:tripeptide aminopeptidase